MACKKPCGNSLTTSAGTYTFYKSEMTQNDATKFCEDKGQILAPITSQEEFNKVNKYVQGCCNLNGITFYHIGLYVVGRDVKLFSNCEKWDSAKHDSLYDLNLEDGPCYKSYYFPYRNKMFVNQDGSCGIKEGRPICFDPAEENKRSAGALVDSKSSNPFTSLSVLSVIIALIALVFGLVVAVLMLVRKLKNLKQELPVAIN